MLLIITQERVLYFSVLGRDFEVHVNRSICLVAEEIFQP